VSCIRPYGPERMSPIPCYGCVCRRFGRHWATRLLRRSISKRSAGKGTDWSWTGRWMPQQHRQPDPSWGEREIEALERWFQRAAHGVRQLVFVSGEAGVGKTTVVDLWLVRQDSGSDVRVARGQCVEHYGEGEPYLTGLEALRQLSHRPNPQEVLIVLRQYAPMWLVQLPGLLDEVALERLQP
jgi:hypothetical protein